MSCLVGEQKGIKQPGLTSIRGTEEKDAETAEKSFKKRRGKGEYKDGMERQEIMKTLTKNGGLWMRQRGR